MIIYRWWHADDTDEADLRRFINHGCTLYLSCRACRDISRGAWKGLMWDPSTYARGDRYICGHLSYQRHLRAINSYLSYKLNINIYLTKNSNYYFRATLLPVLYFNPHRSKDTSSFIIGYFAIYPICFCPLLWRLPKIRILFQKQTHFPHNKV